MASADEVEAIEDEEVSAAEEVVIEGEVGSVEEVCETIESQNIMSRVLTYPQVVETEVAEALVDEVEIEDAVAEEHHEGEAATAVVGAASLV